MRASSIHRLLRVAASTIALSWLCSAGCAPPADVIAGTTACTSTDGCPLGQVCLLGPRDCSILVPDDKPCSLGDGTCQPEPPDRLTGTFRCQVVAKDDPVPEATTSFVIANVGKARIPLTVVSLCTYEDDPYLGAIISLTFSSAKSTRAWMYLKFAIDGSIGSFDRTITLARPSTGLPLDGAVIYGEDDEGHILLDRMRAVTVDGKVVLDTVPRKGAFLSGYIDASLIAGRDTPNLGGACPGGIADCGDGNQLCDEYLVGADTHQMCVRSGKCATDADCAAYPGAACITHKQTTLILGSPSTSTLSQCMKTCTSADECEAPLQCSALQTGHPKVCY